MQVSDLLLGKAAWIQKCSLLCIEIYKKREIIRVIKWKINDDEKGKSVAPQAGEETSIRSKMSFSSFNVNSRIPVRRHLIMVMALNVEF